MTRAGCEVLIWLADDGGPVRSDAARSVDPVGAGDRRFSAVNWGWLADDRRSVGPDASGSVDPVGASGGVALLRESECAKRNHNGEHKVFHRVSFRATSGHLGFGRARRQAPGPSITISMRRFCARPCGVSFEATGCVSPKPLAETTCGLTPCDSRYATTLSARREDRSMLLATPARWSAGPTCMLSV